MTIVNPSLDPSGGPARPPRAIASSRPKRLGIAFAIALWGIAAIAGTTKLNQYSLTPTASATVNHNDWPATTTLARSIGQSTLVIFVHPECPCSRASIAELTDVLIQAQGRLTATVVFAEPQLLGADPLANALWAASSAMPNTTLVRDPAGAIAHAFGALSSGQTFLYDEEGRLCFRGGITDGRGHRGDNAGLGAIRVALGSTSTASPTSAARPVATSPVFGCSLE